MNEKARRTNQRREAPPVASILAPETVRTRDLRDGACVCAAERLEQIGEPWRSHPAEGECCRSHTLQARRPALHRRRMHMQPECFSRRRGDEYADRLDRTPLKTAKQMSGSSIVPRLQDLHQRRAGRCRRHSSIPILLPDLHAVGGPTLKHAYRGLEMTGCDGRQWPVRSGGMRGVTPVGSHDAVVAGKALTADGHAPGI